MKKGCKSGRMEADGNTGEKLDYCRPDNRDPVKVLLDTSEDQDHHELNNNHTDREQCIRGWGRCPPFSCLLLPQQKGRKANPEVPDSHCLLCADLKTLKLSERTAEEPWKNHVPSSWEFHSRTPSTLSSSSSTEEEPSEFTLKERSIGNKMVSGGELCQQTRTLHLLHPNGPWPSLKDRKVGKVALAGAHMVLPPVRGNPRIPEVPILNPTEERGTVGVCGAPRPTTAGKKAAADGHSRSSRIPEAARGSFVSNQGPTLSDLTAPGSWRVQVPIDALPRADLPIARKLRHELIRSPPRHSLGLRSGALRRGEPELPMLLGTRVQIPVSTHRLL